MPRPFLTRSPRSHPLVVVLLATALALAAAVVSPTGAYAAPITAPACVDDLTTPGPEARQLGDAQQTRLRAGDAVPLYDSAGGRGSSVPLCTVRLVQDELRSAWSYCTDHDRGACFGQGRLTAQSGNSKLVDDPLGPDKEQVISYLALHGYPVRDAQALGVRSLANGTTSGDRTHAQRTATQQLIWCVSDADRDVRTRATPGCRGNFTDEDFAAVLARAPEDPVLTVEREGTGPIEAGRTVRFRVTTNLVGQPIAVDADGTSPVALRVCAGDATLRDGGLVIADDAAPGSVALCLIAPAGDTEVRIRATPPSRERLGWYWNGSTGCQVFAHFDRTSQPALEAVARISATALPPVPPVPEPDPVPEPPTTPVPPAPPVPATTPDPAPAAVRSARVIERLGLSKRIDGPRGTRSPGTLVRWRIRVVNPDRRTTARNVTVCDTLPRGVSFVRASPAATLRNGRHCWTIRSLSPGTGRTFTVTARIVPGSPRRLVNRVRATSADVSRTAHASSALRVRQVRAKPGGVTG